MRIVIAEDSVLLRDGLTRMLTDGGFKVVAAVPEPSSLGLLGVAALGLLRRRGPKARPTSQPQP